MVLALAACGEKAEMPKTETGEDVTITLWTYPFGGWGKDETVKELIAAFEAANPGIKVAVEYLDYTNGDDQVNTAIEGKAAPDIIMEGPERLVTNWGAKGYMVDLADLWDADNQSEIYASIAGGDEIQLFRQGVLDMAFCWNILQQTNSENNDARLVAERMDAEELSDAARQAQSAAVGAESALQSVFLRQGRDRRPQPGALGPRCDSLAAQHRLDGRRLHAAELSHGGAGRLRTGKKRFVGRRLIFTLIVCAMALPKQVIQIPLVREMSSLSLYNTLSAVVYPIVGWPFGVFLIKQFAESIPGEILEAARIDGSGELKTFRTIVFPMIKPGVGALAIFTFISSWNDYFMQLIMLSSTKNLTISLGIAKMQAENSTDFGLIKAGAAFAALPIIIVFVIFQKYFTRGITMGAVKG